MRKILMIFAAIILATGSLLARDRVCRDTSCLPQPAKTTLSKNFPKVKVSHIKIDENIVGSKEYEVVLENGCEVDFKGDGSWESVDCGNMAVPSGFILKPIRDYVARNYKGATIVQIDKDRNDYEVELSNGMDLKFDRSGKFLRIDD